VAKRGTKAWRALISKTKRQHKLAQPDEWKSQFDRMVATRTSQGSFEIKRRGGNGTGPSKAQAKLHRLVGGELEYVVSLGKKIGWKKGWPCCFIIDIGFPSVKLGVEVDGESHNNPNSRKRDRRKARRLASLGWRLIRIRNFDVLRDPDEAASVVLKKLRSRQQ
jgi:hypothetical protein